eukprot:g927.t1
MGAYCSSRSPTDSTAPGKDPVETQHSEFHPILDKYETLQDLQNSLREAGLESVHLIVGIDFTKTNERTGKKSFGGKCLHCLEEEKMNFYEQALHAAGETLKPFNGDKQIHAFGFGDSTTRGNGVFPFYPNSTLTTNGLEGVLLRYRQIARHVELSGPKSFVPLIHHAIKLVIDNGFQYHILVILADGQVASKCLEDTQDAIVAASYFPLSIVMIGVGDGPWDQMKHFDDELPKRCFDNFQFVNFCKVMNHPSVSGSNEAKAQAQFALHALMEIPDQYREITKMMLADQDSSWYVPNDQVLYSIPSSIPPLPDHHTQHASTSNV